MTKQAEKIRDAKGYAMLVANVAQFGNETVRVYNGSRKVYEGAADEFVSKHGAKFEWKLCADVRDENGIPNIVY